MKQAKDLIFGALAVQLGKVLRSDLMKAAFDWADRTEGSLSATLLEQGKLSEDDRDIIEGMVRGALATHEGDEQATLATFGGESRVIQDYFGETIRFSEAGQLERGEEVPQPLRAEEVPAVPIHSGRYEGYEEHSAGGMGKIMLVKDKHLDREVALKELLPHHIEGATKSGTVTGVPTSEMLTMPAVARFMQEARVTGSLEHPSIVPIYEVGYRPDGTMYYTMKLVRGKTLQEAISSCKSLRERLGLLSHFLDLCNALAYAHSKGIVHRDVKPLNVMVGEFGETILIDWGIAKIQGQEDIHSTDMETAHDALEKGDEDTLAKTVYGEAMGSPYFMPPEQALGEVEKINSRSDVYALGAVLYTMLTGKLPYLGMTPQEYILAVINHSPKPILELDKEIPPELVAVCERAMAKDSNDRYPSAKEMADEIQAFLSGGLVAAYTYKFTEHLQRFVAKHKAVLSSAAAGVAAVIALGIFSYIQVSNQRTVAVTAQADAEEARDNEAIARTDAEDALDVAVIAQNEAEIQRAIARRELYFANISLAERAIDENRMAQAREKLANAPEEHRNWEWHHLNHEANADLLTLESGGRFAAYIQDGVGLLLASSGGTVTLHDAKTGSLTRAYTENAGFGHGIALSASGESVAIASDSSIGVWNVATGDTQFNFDNLGEASDRVPHRIALNQDASLVAAQANDGIVHIWNVVSGKEVSRFKPERPQRVALTFRPGTEQILITSATFTDDGWAGRVILWDVPSNAEVSSHSLAPPFYAQAAVLDTSGDLMALSTGEAVELWSVASWQKTGSFRAKVKRNDALTFSPDAGLLIAGGTDGSVTAWDTASQSARFASPATGEAVYAITFLDSADRVALSGANSLIRLLDTKTGEVSANLRGHDGAVFTLASYENRLTSGSFDGTTKVWDLRSDLALAQASGVDGTSAGTVLTGIVGAEAVSWDTATGASLSRVAVNDQDISAVADQPNGPLLAMATSSQVDGQSRDLVTLFDRESGNPVRELPPLDSKVRDLTFSPDGTLIGARYGVKFTVWEADTGAEKWAFDKNAAAIFSADGSKLAVADTDGAVSVWSLASGEQVMATTIEQKFGVTLAFDPTGQRLAASTDPLVGNSYQGGVLVWDISRSGEPMHTLSGTGGHVYSLEFSTDGALLASGHNSGNVVVWKMEDGSQTATLEGHTGAVVALAMTKSAVRLATASLDGTFKLWDTSTGREFMTLHDTALTDAGTSQPARILFTRDRQYLLAITQPQALQPIILQKR